MSAVRPKASLKLSVCCLLSGVLPLSAAPALTSPSGYAVVFDAGSTGTRVHVYRFERGHGSAPAVVFAVPGGTLKVTPGVSFFASDPARAGRSILPLLELASRIVPIAHQPDALVFLRATGGMRLVPEPHRSQLYDELFAAVAAHPSQLKATREAFGTLSGELEGVYAFLSVNHLLARMGQISPSEIGSVGALDLGGASTQITTPRGDTDAAPPHRGTSDISAPLPRQGEGAAASGGGGVLPPGVVAVALPGRRGRREALVFSHSHLGFGNKQVMSALTLRELSTCLPAGACATAAWELTTAGLLTSESAAIHARGSSTPAVAQGSAGSTEESTVAGGFCGTGAPALCEAAIARALGRFDHTVGQPAVHGRRFVGMSLFFYSVNFAILAGHLPRRAPPRYTPAELASAAHALCVEPYASLLNRMKGRDPLTPDGAIAWRCFDLLYASRLLVDGYGLPSGKPGIEFYGEIDGTEVEWTLGAVHAHLAGAGRRGSAHPPPGAVGGWGALLLVVIGVAVLCFVGRRLTLPTDGTSAAHPYVGVGRRV